MPTGIPEFFPSFPRTNKQISEKYLEKSVLQSFFQQLRHASTVLFKRILVRAKKSTAPFVLALQCHVQQQN